MAKTGKKRLIKFWKYYEQWMFILFVMIQVTF